MKAIRVISLLLARLFLSLYFLVSAFQKILNWSASESELINALCDWQSTAGSSQSLQECVTFLIPWGTLLHAIGTLFDLLGGMMLLFGFRERLGALLLILVLVPSMILFHSFWWAEGAAQELQQILFFKDLTIVGGMLLVVLHGIEAKGSDSRAGSF